MVDKNYWVVSPNVKNNEEEEEDWKSFLSLNPYSFIGWGVDNKYGRTFIEKIKKGDVIINAQRKNWKANVFGIGIVKTDICDFREIEETPSGAYCRELFPYLTKERLENLRLDFEGTAYYGENKQIPAIYQLHPERNPQDKSLINKIETEFKNIEMDTYIKRKVELLLSSKNLILTGAPGTGKTYLAKQIAMQMILGQIKEEKGFTEIERTNWKERYDFVQFHPSYDYTDFVEGLRPKKEEGQKEIGFELKNGVFKDFCIKAKNNTNENYVYIIDEINRGEISKIFGELFFSIDPSYRGKDGKVKTQYANIQKGETIFDDELGKGWFYVPENVYIIGTMNDIDRSVESFDFAMRRRFAWKEITAEDNRQKMFDNMSWKEEAIKRMDALNNAIWNEKEGKGIEGLNSSYHIGAAYFKTNLPKYDENERFQKLWEYHLQPLLFEYLRGMTNSQKNMQKFENAYNLIDNPVNDDE